MPSGVSSRLALYAGEELLTHLAAADVKHDCHVARAFLFDHIE